MVFFLFLFGVVGCGVYIENDFVTKARKESYLKGVRTGDW